MGKIIVVEDNLVYSRYVCNFLEENGYRTVSTSDCTGARKLFSMLEDDDIVLADLRLPDGDGILLLEELRREGKHNPYVIMTDYAEVPTAVRSMKSGAEDYIPKKLLTSQLPAMLQDLQKRQSFHEEPLFIRESEAYQKVFGRLHVLAKADICVMVRGENGTGKKHIAEKIHAQSDRADKPFVTVDCGLLSESLAASALFGHEKGAFTGANAKGKEGLLEAANGGTLFMDEIGELPLDMQKKLLRAIQEGAIIRVGGTKTKKINVRFICATNKTTEELRNPAVFRQDLYYRLNVIPVEVPALRDRREDIMPLVGYYLQHFNGKYHRKVFLAGDAERVLYEYQWPGNIRELKNVIERCVVLAPHDEIDGLQMDRMLGLGGLDKIQGKQFIESVGAVERQRDAAESSLQKDEEGENIVIKEIMDINEAHRICEQIIIKKAVEKYGNVTKAAEAVGINPSTIYRKIKSGHLEL